MPMTCENARDLLLDHVYGALDEPDDAALRAHIADCAICRGGLDEARAQREVLAEAAREEPSGLRLVPPRPPLRIVTTRRLVAAAALLVACAGFASAWRSAQVGEAERLNPRVAVLAPTSVAPGQPAEFLVDVTTASGDPLAADVLLTVYGGNQSVLATKSGRTDAGGKARVVLDPGLGAPGEQLRVAVATRLEGGVERHASTVLVRDGTRLLARVATDKPLYRPGETVRVRAVALERFALTPAGSIPITAEVLDPRGGKAATAQLPSAAGVAAWEWPIPAGAAGGEWKLVLSAADKAHPAFPTTERVFVVRSYRVPRIKGDLELDKDSYGPGDAGELAFSVERAEGGVPAGAQVEAILTVDGSEIERSRQTLTASGAGSVRFTLPKEIAEGDAHVALVVTDGGAVETLTKTVPVALGRLDVELFPEGGDLVAGLPTRVYFRAREPRGEPADLVAEVVDGAGRVVSEARVDALGMGRFEITPEAGAVYRLRAKTPAGIALRAEFPPIVASGVSLRALDDVTAAGKPVRIEIAATEGGRHAVTASCRGVMVAQETVDLAPRERRVVALAPTAGPGGVLRITAYGPDSLPRAERLVSLAPQNRLSVEMRPASAKYAPGDTVKVEVTTRDETGRPVPAVLGVSVVDEAVLRLANDEDTASFPQHFLLGLEVDAIERAEVYAQGPDAARAVDRLLGVQGWRRFAWKAPAEFLAKHPDGGPRVVIANALDTPQRTDNFEQVRWAVRTARRTADRQIVGVSVTCAVGIAFLAGLAAFAAGLVTKRTRLAIGGVATSVLVAAGVFVTMSVAERQFAPTEAKVAMDAAPRAAAPAGGATPPGAKVEDAIRLPDGGVYRGPLGEVPPDTREPGDPPPPPEADPALGFVADLEEQNGRLLPDAKPGRPGGDGPGRRGDAFFDRNERAAFKQVALARVYAHRKRPKTDGVRDDFAEVLYWHPMLVTGPDGRASFDFDTSDSVTTFTIAADAHDARGALATATAGVTNRIPFFLEPKLPVALSAGDALLLPVVVANDTEEAMDVFVDVALANALLRRGTPGELRANVAAGGRARVLCEVLAGHGQGDVALTVTGRGRGLLDRSRRAVAVVPRGFPIDIAKGGVLERQDAIVVHLPEDLDRATLAGSLRLYPSVLATLEDGMESMLREPCGCFEQASSSNYPNVLVLNYLEEAGGGSPEVMRRAKEMLARGYARLTGYECKQKGYEWFGGDPGHEALTAYGLMEFADMARVHPVDDSMVGRTRDWLLARRDGSGGFRRNDRALDSFGRAPAEITDAYIVWALTEADAKAPLGPEIAKLIERARSSDDGYLVGLAARVAANVGRAEAKDLLARLVSLQGPDGRVAGKTTSITSSRGANLDVETTALAALAFVKDPARLPQATLAVQWLVAQRKNGGSFGATQATILALRALVEHARSSKRTATDHEIALTVNGRFIVKRRVAAGTPGAIEFEREVLDALVSGENRIEFTTTSAETLPWALALRYHATLPASDPGCAVGVTTALAQEKVAEGETVRLDVTIANRTSEGVPMTLARIGLPAGLEPRPEQLKELKESGAIDFYETRPREVTLYLRGLAPLAGKRVSLDLVAAIPGTFEGPASSAYLYYTDDQKTWTAPLRCTIEPR